MRKPCSCGSNHSIATQEGADNAPDCDRHAFIAALPRGPRRASAYANCVSDSEVTALSDELADASAELGCRVEMGEFDDLDDVPLGDLQGLGLRLGQWARRVRMLEQATSQSLGALPSLTMPTGAAALIA